MNVDGVMESLSAVVPSVSCGGHAHRNRALFGCAAHVWVAMARTVADQWGFVHFGHAPPAEATACMNTCTGPNARLPARSGRLP